MPNFLYAVKAGRQCGIFSTWGECEKQVKGFPNAKYKKFSSTVEANEFLNGNDSDSSRKRKLENHTESSNKKQKIEVGRLKNDRTAEKSAPLNENVVVVYTDGCSHDNGKANARAGLGVYWGSVNHPDNLSERLSGRQTNNRAEIMAAVRALQQAHSKGIKHLEIRTDSAFLINCVTKWMSAWKKRNWMLSSGNPVINREELEELDAAQKGIKVDFVHVRGHQGIEGNEQADRLANEGATKPAR